MALNPMATAAQRTLAGLQSLSGRLVVLAIAYVLAAQFIIYVPTIALYRYEWLSQRADSALLAALAREGISEYTDRLADQNIEDVVFLTRLEGDVADTIKDRILDTAGIRFVAVRQNAIRQLVLRGPPSLRVDYSVNLSNDDIFTLIGDAYGTLFSDSNRIINVIDKPDETGFAVEYAVEEAPLRAAMLQQSRTIWFVAGIISIVTGVLLFATIFRLLVRPMRRITRNMVSFRQAPEDASRVLRQTHHIGELAEAEHALADLQHDVRVSLRQKSRLAALGEAVAKINHDLRNMLASAQLLTDRIAMSEDPAVQNAAPRLVAAIDRAVGLSTNVLKYGKAEETAPERRDIDLHAVLGDVAAGLNLDETSDVTLTNNVPPGLLVNADSDHLFRILMNLIRNSANALAPLETSGEKRIEVAVRQSASGWEITVSDNGPGIPERIRESIFQAFVSSGPGGSGLGLAISAELARAHGGKLDLVRTDETGTEFLIFIPHPIDESAAS